MLGGDIGVSFFLSKNLAICRQKFSISFKNEKPVGHTKRYKTKFQKSRSEKFIFEI
jgi:hypothetical protein